MKSSKCRLMAGILLVVLVLSTLAEGRSISRDARKDTPETAEADSETAEADQLTLRFSTPDHASHELMMKAKVPTVDVPTYISGRNGKIIRWQKPQGYSLTTYVDEESQASIVVENRKDIDGKTTTRYRGNFVAGNRFYYLAPVMKSSAGENVDRFQPIEGSITVRIGDVDHYVAPATSNHHQAYDNIVASAHLREASNSRTDSRDKANYVVELMIAGDYSLYKYWLETYTGELNSLDREREALFLLRHYFSAAAEQINMRYTSIKESDFQLSVKLVGFFFATTVDQSQFTEGSDVKITFEGWGYTKMDTCLKQFGAWVAANADYLGPFDHIVLFVGNYLYDKLVDGAPSTKSGLANVGGVCNKKQGLCTSINYERGFYSTCQTGAHELAHNLGAAHDGESNECKGTDQFVMASAPGELTEAIYNNPYTFSPCSIRYFRDFLSSLTSSGKNCLLTEESTVEIQIEGQLPGTIQDANQQCYNYQGLESFYCAGMIHDAEICQKIVCWDTEDNECRWETAEHRAYAGTTCGNKKWCFRGECVPDERAPAAKDYCTYGDYRGLMHIDEANPRVSCEDMVAKFPEQCYNPDKVNRCCEACPSIKNHDKPDCEFGDRSPQRCKDAKEVHCYDESFKHDCCDWCEKVMGTEKGCEYGDKADWCATVTNEQCYENHETCCKSCQQHYTGVAGCEYGDTVTWCSSQNLDASSCQPQSDTGKKCCGSCHKKFPDGIPTDGAPPSGGEHTNVDATAKCPQGDTAGAAHCAAMKEAPHQCYQSESTCCATCEKLHTGNADCAYGDEVAGCAGQVDADYCREDPGVMKQCCGTCHSLMRRGNLDFLEELLDKLQ